MKKKWTIKRTQNDCSALLHSLLCSRNIQWDDGPEFLAPLLSDLKPPNLIPGLDRAVLRLEQAIENEERVLVYSDYDVDGTTSAALMSRLLDAYCVVHRVFVPCRTRHGYGLSVGGLIEATSEFRPNLVLALDCGTTSCREAEWLSKKGSDLIVVDHHKPKDVVPDCHSVVNPQLSSQDNGMKDLCTAGLVFKLMHQMLMHRDPSIRLDLYNYLDLVALGTVADVVPLVGDNRILVKHGLEQMENTIHPGIRALKSVSGVQGRVTSQDVGFQMAPRINAAGRIKTAETALQTLLAISDDTAITGARALDSANEERKEMERRYMEEAEGQVAQMNVGNRASIVVQSRHWHKGVVGIVASRLMHKYHRPVFALGGHVDSRDSGGSGRSIKGVSLVKFINRAREIMSVEGGGHDMAAGVTMPMGMEQEFARLFEQDVRVQLQGDPPVKEVVIDSEVGVGDINMDLLNLVERLEPYGQGNPEPLFCVRGVTIRGGYKVMKERHLKMVVEDGEDCCEMLWFNAPVNEVPEGVVDLTFRISRNTFRGEESVQAIVGDFRESNPQS